MRTLTAVTLLALMATPLMADEVTITGRVIGPDGEAIEGAVVRVATDYRAPVQAVLAETTVGEDGAFVLTFTDEAAGDQYVIAAEAEGYVTSGERVEPGAEIELRLSDRTMPVRGRVVDETGAAVVGAVVRSGNISIPPLEGFSTPTWHNLLKPTATTGANGEFELRGLFDGSKLGLWVDAEGFGGWRGGMKPESFPVTHEWSITPQPEGVVAGRVLGEGQPIEGLRISAVSQEGHPQGRSNAVTDADGRFELRGLWPSTYEVLVATEQDWIAPAVGGVAVEAGERAEGVEIDLVQTATVNVQLRDADSGEPITAAALRATSSARPATGRQRHSASANESGRLTLHLPPGRAQLEWTQVRGNRRVRLEPDAIDVPAEMAGKAMEVVVSVRPALLASGAVVGPDGQPVAGAILIGRHGETLVTTDADGRFRLLDAAEGLSSVFSVCMLVASADAGLVGVLRCEVGVEDVRVAMTPSAEMILRAEDEEGNGVQGLDMTIGLRERVTEDMDRYYAVLATYTSDAEGVVRMGPLPSGVELRPMPSPKLMMMTPRAGALWSRLQPVTLDPGETRDLGPLTVPMKKRSVSGIVLRDGGPEAGATVLAATNAIREGLSVVTDEGGRFRIDDIPPTRDVTLVAMSADRKLAAGTIWCGEPAGPLTLELLPTSPVQGRAIAADGRPAPGTKLSVSAVHAVSAMRQVAPLTLSASTQAGEDGRWRVDGLIAGFEYRVMTLEPMHEGGPMRMAEEFGTITPLGETEPFEVDIDLRPKQDEQ